MSNLRMKALLGAGCFSLALASVAHAGGFSRGNADTDILFEDGNFNMRAGVTYVSPKREFTKNPNPALVGTSYTDDYIIPSAAIKLNFTDNIRCAATMVDNNGGSATYAYPKVSGKLEEEFTTNEKALTCGVKFNVGQGQLWLLGGGYMENFDYDRLNALPIPGAFARLTLDGEEFGYRAGIAYAIPEIALRAQLMYRSGTSYGASGSLTVPGALIGSPAASVALPAIGTGNLPQTVELKLQSGIAPGWLAFGSVKWADWSVQKELLVTTSIPGIGSQDVYNWKDGWTVSGGVGHAFNEKVSGLVSLTWDQGVLTGYDLSSDTYTLAVGGSFKDAMGGELRAGVGVSYLTSADITKGSDAGTSVDSGYAIAGSVGYSVKW